MFRLSCGSFGISSRLPRSCTSDAPRSGCTCRQSPLSRAIRELERELGLVLFVRTTRRVELTAAGSALLEHARRALTEVNAAVDEARHSAEPDRGTPTVGYGPFSRSLATRIAEEVAAQRGELQVRLDEDVTPELLRRVAARELAAAVVMETPAAARRHGVRIDALRDEPLPAALPARLRERGCDSRRCLRRGMRAVVVAVPFDQAGYCASHSSGVMRRGFVPVPSNT